MTDTAATPETGTPDTDDVAGHVRRPSITPETPETDDVAGHVRRPSVTPEADDDDVQGHRKL